MLHLEFNITRRHIFVLVAAIAVIVAMVPLASYAADRFTDVPDSNIFHDDITWLADAGVTLGCNPPTNDEFCPSDNVRRETMAAFMRRLAENQVVDAKTAIDAENAVKAEDAEQLDGQGPAAYQTVVSGQAFDYLTSGTITLPAGTATTIVETSISAPASGYLLITNTATLTSNASGLVTGTWVQLDDTVCAGTSVTPTDNVAGTLVYSSAVDTNDENAHAGSAVVAVDAGDHTVTYCGASDGSASTTVWSANVMALWTADGTSSVVAGAGSAGSAGVNE